MADEQAAPEQQEAEEQSIQSKVHEAMEKHGGDRVLAAQELGISLQTIKNKIYECPDLRRRWAKDEVTPPDEIDTLARQPLTTEDERAALAIKRENEKVRKGVEALGLTEAEIKLAMSFQAFNRDCFRSSMDMAIAGATRTGLKLVNEIDRILLRLEQVRLELIGLGANVTDERPLLVEEERGLNEQLASITAMQIKLMDKTVDASAKLALVNHKIRNGSSTAKKAKPAFQAVGDGVEVEVQ